MQIRSSRFALRPARRVVAAAILLAAAAAPAAGADIGVGASVGAAEGRGDCIASFACDRSSTSWKLFAVWRLSETLEMQALGFGAARFKGGDTAPDGSEFGGSFKAAGIGLTGGYRWAFAPAWSLVGRAGMASVRTRFRYADGTVAEVGKTSVQPMLGLSLARQLTPAVGLGLDYDLTRFKAHRTNGALHLFGVTAHLSF